MDGTRFDQLTRLVGRRQVIKSAAAAILAGITRRVAVDDAGATLVCVLTCPANIIQSNDPNQCGAVVAYPAPNFDPVQCGTVICAAASGSFFPVGPSQVNCTSSTGAGTCFFNVTINDTQAPTVTCPSDIFVTGAPPQTVNYVATASDNCPGVTIQCIPASGSSFPSGDTDVTCTGTDSSGNTATCGFCIEIIEPSVTATDTATATEEPTSTSTDEPTSTSTEEPTSTSTESGEPNTDTATIPATDVPATEVPATEAPTEDPETQSPATEVPTATTATVTQLPNTGSNDRESKNWLLPAGLLGAGAALAARLGLRNLAAAKSESTKPE